MSHAIGQSVRRMEDAPLLTGRGRFTDDINLVVPPVLRCPRHRGDGRA